MFTKESISKLGDIYHSMQGELNYQQNRRQRYLDIDKALQKESDESAETRKGKAATASGDKSKFANIEVGITQQYKEAAEAYMVGTFLTGDPIFAAVSNRRNEDAASMLTALAKRDQHRLGWVGELSRCFDDVLKYNICGAEVAWGERTAVNAITQISEGSTQTARFNPTIYEGNLINRLDPYNLVYDRDVEPSKVHIDGGYAGYIKLHNYIGLKRLYESWNELYIIKQNIEKAFQSKGTTQYYKPVIRRDAQDTSGSHWEHWWGNTNNTIDMKGASGKYEVLTLYKRIIPKEHSLNIPQKGSPQVFKLIYVNSHLAYAEPIVAGHEYLPIIIGQVYPGSSQLKSFTEYLMPMQDLSTASIIAVLDSMRRAVGDRALYDPKRIRKQDIESTNPVSKIPVTGNVYDEHMSSAYYQIPYQDNVSPLFNQMLGTVFTLADNETGINRAAQGNFIKGNKTMFEFGTIMSNSESRLQLGALKLNQNFIAPIKEIIKLNYLVYAKNEAIDNDTTDETITIDPVQLRKQAPEFKMADGLMPTTKIAGTEVLMQTAQLFTQNPMAFMNYDIEGMLVSAVKQQGFYDVDNYRRTPEQQQQFIQMMGMTQGGQNSGNQQGQPPTTEEEV